MSGINNNFTQRRWTLRPRGFLWPEEGYGTQGAFNSYSSRVVRQVIYRNPLNNVFVSDTLYTSNLHLLVVQLIDTAGAGGKRHGSASLPELWAVADGRVTDGPLSGFPSFLLPLLGEVIARDTIYSPINSIPAPPLELMREEGVDPNRTIDMHKKALKMLRKEIYNPAPKRLTKRVSQCYMDGNSESSSNNYKAKQEDDDDKKCCTICLDDFEAKQVVTVAPCNHMFHEDCIVPWVKSHGQCPVCRSRLSDQM